MADDRADRQCYPPMPHQAQDSRAPFRYRLVPSTGGSASERLQSRRRPPLSHDAGPAREVLALENQRKQEDLVDQPTETRGGGYQPASAPLALQGQERKGKDRRPELYEVVPNACDDYR